jgi:hypothetical protein
MKVSPIKSEDGLTEEEQKAEGVEADEIIKYYQDIRLFNSTDYYGKSKGLSMNYNRDMKLEFFMATKSTADVEETMELLDTFLLDDLKA